MYLWTVITICIAVELLFLYNGVFLFLCVVVPDECYTVPVVLWRPVSWFGGVFRCFLLGPMTLNLILIPSFLLLSHTVCWCILDCPGVLVGFLVFSVEISCQNTRSTVMYTVVFYAVKYVLYIYIFKSFHIYCLLLKCTIQDLWVFFRSCEKINLIFTKYWHVVYRTCNWHIYLLLHALICRQRKWK